VPVLAGERGPVNLAASQLRGTKSGTEAGQRVLPGDLTRKEQGRVSLPNPGGQPGRDPSRCAAPPAPVADSMSQAVRKSGLIWLSQIAARAPASPIRATSARTASHCPGKAVRKPGSRRRFRRALRSSVTAAGTDCRMIFQRGSRTRGTSAAGGSLPNTGSFSARYRRAGTPRAAESEAAMLMFT
jgi:hypothetical protein